MKSRNIAWLLGASMMASTSAFAQTAPHAQGEASARADPAPPDVAEVAADAGGIADIVVTAQKRSENLQRTPAAVTALTPEVIATKGLTSMTAIQFVVPSARFQQQSTNVQVFLRGIGANLDNPEIDPAVAVNVDGIYMPREGVGVALFDIGRIEVLPGPQGTLYGRNAIGGTVNIGANRPTDRFEGSATLEVGNYDLVHGTAVINSPISDDLSVRGAFNYTWRDGYMTNGADSQDDFALRLSALYKPSTDFSVYLWGLAAWNNGSIANAVNRGFDPRTGQLENSAYLNDNPWDTSREGFTPFGEPQAGTREYHNYVAGTEVNAQLNDDVALTYLGSYLDLRGDHFRSAIGAIPTTYFVRYKQTTHEFRLSGDTSRLKWQVGLYGYRQKNSGRYNFFAGTPLEFSIVRVDRNKIEGVAGFGQATYALTDSLRLTAGGRYSIDHREGGAAVSPVDGQPYSFEKTYRRFDYKVGAEFDLSPEAMTYLTYQTGYQPGTYNEVQSSTTFDNEIDPQKIKAFTGGLKTRWLDNRLQINLEAFYYIYRDFFVQAADVNSTFQPIFNAQKVEIPGVQLDVTARPTRLDQLSFSASFTHARNKEFITPGGEDFSGLAPAYASDWTLIGGYGRDFEIGTGDLHFDVSGRYESKRWADYRHSFGVRQDPQLKIDSSLTYRPEGGLWSLAIWGKNLTNRATMAAAAPGGIPGPASAYLEAPRTYGARASINF